MQEYKNENEKQRSWFMGREWFHGINTILLIVAIISILYTGYFLPTAKESAMNAEKEFMFKMDLVRGPYCTTRTQPYYVEDMNAFNQLTVWDNYWNELGTGYIVAQKCLIFQYGFLTREAFSKYYEQPRVQVKFKKDLNT